MGGSSNPGIRPGSVGDVSSPPQASFSSFEVPVVLRKKSFLKFISEVEKRERSHLPQMTAVVGARLGQVTARSQELGTGFLYKWQGPTTGIICAAS